MHGFIATVSKLFKNVLIRIRRDSRIHPVCSFCGACVRFRSHPCSLFLPIRSALTPFRILSKRYTLKLKKTN